MQLQSHNTALDRSARKWLVPSFGQMAVYIVSAFLLLVVMNLAALWTYFNGTVGVSSETASAVIQEPFQRFSDFTTGLFEGRLAPMLFWGFLGVLTYMIIWFIQNAANNVHNDIAAEQYMHPWTFKSKKYWWSIAADKIFFVCVLLIFVLFVYLCASLFLPVLSKLFYSAIYNWHFSGSVPRLLGSVLFMSFVLYIFVLLAVLVRNSWRWVNSNL